MNVCLIYLKTVNWIAEERQVWAISSSWLVAIETALNELEKYRQLPIQSAPTREAACEVSSWMTNGWTNECTMLEYIFTEWIVKYFD